MDCIRRNDIGFGVIVGVVLMLVLMLGPTFWMRRPETFLPRLLASVWEVGATMANVVCRRDGPRSSRQERAQMRHNLVNCLKTSSVASCLHPEGLSSASSRRQSALPPRVLACAGEVTARKKDRGARSRLAVTGSSTGERRRCSRGAF